MKLTDLIDAKYRSPTQKYYCDYPTVKIGGGNPYYKCASCGRSDFVTDLKDLPIISHYYR